MREIVTIVGVIAGLSYYVMTVRNQNKARQIQLIAQLADSTSAEAQKRAYPLLSYQWEDYDDFERKYGSDVDLEGYAVRYGVWSMMNRTGFLLKEGLISMDMLVGSLGGQLGAMWQWRKFEPIIRKQREIYKMPLLFQWWEYLAGEFERYYEERGYTDLMPENLGTYVSEE